MVLAGVDKIMRMQAGQILDYDKRDVVIERHRGNQRPGAATPQACRRRSLPHEHAHRHGFSRPVAQ